MAADFGSAFIGGLQAAQQNALARTQIQRQQRINSLASNPNATPEDYIRAGDTNTGQALLANQQTQQSNQMQAVTQIATIARQAASIAQQSGVAASKQFTQQALATYGQHFKALGVNADQALGQLAQMPDDQYLQGMQQAAQLLPPNYQKMGPGESIVDMNRVGAAPVMSTPGKVSYEDTGGEKTPVDSVTGVVRKDLPPLKKTTPPAQQFTTDSVEQTAQMIAQGQIPMLSGFALKTPWGQQVVGRVGELSRQNQAAGGDAYNAGTFTSRSKAMRDFNTGAQGNAVRYMNTAISHINTLEQLGAELDNSHVQAINKLKNFWKTQTGQSAPVSFTAARDIVANEVVKAVTASGGGVADRQEAQAQLSNASSWSQLAAVAQTWKQLLAGQLGSLRLQYEQGTGLKDFNKKLYPETLRELGSAEGQSPSPPSNSPPTQEITATGPDGKQIVLRNGQWVPK